MKFALPQAVEDDETVAKNLLALVRRVHVEKIEGASLALVLLYFAGDPKAVDDFECRQAKWERKYGKAIG